MVNCTYKPQSTLPHTIEINYGTVAADGSPFRVYVSAPPDVSKIHVSGNWFDGKPKPYIRNGFQIDASCYEEYTSDIDVHIVHEETSRTVPYEIKLDKKGVHHIELTPSDAGTYSTKLYCAGILLPQSRDVFIAPIIDSSKLITSGLTTEPNFVGRAKEFTIHSNDMSAAIDCKLLAITISGPNGNAIPNSLKMNENNHFQISYTPQYAGYHTISIMYDNAPIPGSPFNLIVKNYCEPNRCKAIGDGLISGVTGIVSKFDIETRDAGLGGLTLAIEGPAETKLKCIDNKNGSCSVQYIPNEAGDYEISILFANTHIPGSPYKVSITNPVRPDKVRIFGPATENRQIKVGEPTFFSIDVSDAGPGLIAVTINNVHGIPVDNVMVVNKGGGLYTVSFIPPAENIIVIVKFDHQNIASRYCS